MKSTTTLLALAGVASAHFNLNYPKARGFNEDKLGNFPCGGQDTVGARTPWPISNGSISLEMGHITANVLVLLGLGNDPGTAFTHVLRPTFSEQGLGLFCITSLSVPSNLNISEGTNATIQVLTNGDPNGGLYNCADITFTNAATGPPASGTGACVNQTGTSVTATNVKALPNETTPSATSSAGAAATKTNAADAVRMGLGGLLVAGAGAVAMVL